MLEDISINETSGIPIWLQLRDRILFQIRSRQLVEGDTLPTVRELATQIGVNYNTVHKVYQDLRADGYIDSKRGRRSFVTGKTPDDSVEKESPINMLLTEAIKLSSEAGISRAELLARFDECYAAFQSKR